jgi:hypothetical protein
MPLGSTERSFERSNGYFIVGGIGDLFREQKCYWHFLCRQSPWFGISMYQDSEVRMLWTNCRNLSQPKSKVIRVGNIEEIKAKIWCWRQFVMEKAHFRRWNVFIPMISP